ncbi:MAG: MopE-related protein, partial [Pseudomonadota bacterium]
MIRIAARSPVTPGGPRRGGARAAALAVAIGALVETTPATAVVTQPTGEMMPSATPPNEVTIVVQRGFTADTVTLEGLFSYRGEALQPVRDAHTTPGTFSPMCGFTGQLVLRGGGCHLGLGWYNVTPGSTTPPPAAEIYLLVPAQLPRCPMPIDPMMACCDDTEFCPLANFNSTLAPEHRWNSPTFTADNIRTDTRYKGGLIGFAMIGAEQCSQTKFSQAELNTKSPAGAPTNGAPWVTTLVYQSTVNPNGYYLAFEDLPVTAATWKGANNGNDGDFNDFVYYITGLNCEGGGKACETGMKGLCAAGTTQCTNGTAIVCKPDVPASTEICDGLDNDCDGAVDQGNPCPGANQNCDRGVCVNKCNDTDFPCATGTQCDQGY